MKETVKKRLNFVLLPVVHTFCYHVNSELVTTTEIKQLHVIEQPGSLRNYQGLDGYHLDVL